MGHETPIIQRLHITFGKFGALKYVGNIDIAKVWERVLRRAKLPVLYTQGFNTRPRIQFAASLGLGITSECEIIDIALDRALPALDGLPEQIMAVAPDGLTVYRVQEVPANGPPLQTLVRSAEYRVRFVDGLAPETLQARIDDILARERIVKIVERKRRKTAYDLRPMILDLSIDDSGDLIAHLSTGERGNLRPSDVLEQMALGDHYVQIHKYAMHLDDYDFHTMPNRRERGEA